MCSPGVGIASWSPIRMSPLCERGRRRRIGVGLGDIRSGSGVCGSSERLEAMRQALSGAQGWGRVHPNPMVGAVCFGLTNGG